MQMRGNDESGFRTPAITPSGLMSPQVLNACWRKSCPGRSGPLQWNRLNWPCWPPVSHRKAPRLAHRLDTHATRALPPSPIRRSSPGSFQSRSRCLPRLRGAIHQGCHIQTISQCRQCVGAEKSACHTADESVPGAIHTERAQNGVLHHACGISQTLPARLCHRFNTQAVSSKLHQIAAKVFGIIRQPEITPKQRGQQWPVRAGMYLIKQAL